MGWRPVCPGALTTPGCTPSPVGCARQGSGLQAQVALLRTQMRPAGGRVAEHSHFNPPRNPPPPRVSPSPGPCLQCIQQSVAVLPLCPGDPPQLPLEGCAATACPAAPSLPATVLDPESGGLVPPLHYFQPFVGYLQARGPGRGVLLLPPGLLASACCAICLHVFSPRRLACGLPASLLRLQAGPAGEAACNCAPQPGQCCNPGQAGPRTASSVVPCTCILTALATLSVAGSWVHPWSQPVWLRL